jgi:flagellar biosynthesis protein FlhA
LARPAQASRATVAQGAIWSGDLSLTAHAGAIPATGRAGRDVGFAIGIVLILCLFFLPVPAFLIDIGLAFSIALSVLILMVALWIQKPLEFSAFPTILLVATVLRLALNISTTRLILAHGATGATAAGYIIGGFAELVMGGDFVIGIIVFLILVTINFLVITKGATRIAEVGARFTLDAIPGKQMAIDADLSSGLIDERVAQVRRRELEEESSFFGSMDGASKFVRGDAIAGLIILAVNIFGGIVIGVTRHGLSLAAAGDIFTKLSVGDGLVSQIPALIISLAAGMLVAKGGTRGSTDKAVLGQLGNYPNALFLAALLMFVLGVIPGLPLLPFALLGGLMAFVGIAIPRRIARERASEAAEKAALDEKARSETRSSIKEQLKSAEIELCLSKELTGTLLAAHDEIASRVAKMRRKFARQYGFVVPEIKVSDDIRAPAKTYQIRIHGTIVATQELRVREHLVIVGDGRRPNVPGDEVREPAFGMRAISISEAFVKDARREGFKTVDPVSVLLTHLSEVIHSNLAQLLSYKDMRALIERLEPEYKRLVEDLCPSQISYSALQAVLKLLLAERVSIRNLNLVLEAVAEIAPHARRPEQIAEHVRMRMGQQICGELQDKGALKVLRLGNRWDLAFHQSLRRDAKGDIVEFDLDPRLMEQFAAECSAAIRKRMDERHQFALVTTAETRPYVRMIVERMFPTLAVLSQLEIARGLDVRSLGTVS